MAVIGLDPGLVRTGWAVAVEGWIVALGSIAGDRGEALARRVLDIVAAVRHDCPSNEWVRAAVELPRHYPGARAHGDGNDLIRLAALSGALLQSFADVPRVELVEPKRWISGGGFASNKEIRHKRLLASGLIDPAALAGLSKADLRDALDAAGIALWMASQLSGHSGQVGVDPG